MSREMDKIREMSDEEIDRAVRDVNIGIMKNSAKGEAAKGNRDKISNLKKRRARLLTERNERKRSEN